jgi:hypothetical protein
MSYKEIERFERSDTLAVDMGVITSDEYGTHALLWDANHRVGFWQYRSKGHKGHAMVDICYTLDSFDSVEDFASKVGWSIP